MSRTNEFRTFAFACAIVLASRVDASITNEVTVSAWSDWNGPDESMTVYSDTSDSGPVLLDNFDVPFVGASGIANVTEGNGHSLQARAEASWNGYTSFFPGTLPRAVAEVETTLNDPVKIVGDADAIQAALDAYGPIFGDARLTGFISITSTLQGDEVWWAESKHEVRANFNGVTFEIDDGFSELSRWPPFTDLIAINEVLTAELSFVQTAVNTFSAPYVSTMYVSATAVAGAVDIDILDTFDIESIRFADGTTPEELGFEVIFESGRLSPNLEQGVVPEPASLSVWSSIAALAGFSAWRKRRSA